MKGTLMAKKKQLPEEVAHSEAYVKDFFDMAVPSAIRFNVDHFICGDSYRSVWAIREYPPQTSDQALLARFGDKEAVTVHLYTRLVDGVEQRKILQNASRKNKLLANSNDLEDSVTGEGNLGDVVELLGELRKNREPLLHCAVFIELSAGNLDKLRELQSDVSMEMTREKISVDHLSMRQKEGFIACMPCGYSNARAWQLLLRSHTQELADALRIPLEDLKWYGAFHNESHHPHIHVIAYTDDPKVGYLSKNGVEQMRSALGNHIFRDDLQHIFRKQTEKRNELKKDWHTLLEKILADMAENPNTHPEIEARLAELSLRLSRTKGKKVYGYLKRDIKDLIDEIVDLLAEDENIAKLYDLWYEKKYEALRTYTSEMPPKIPLSQNKEFKSIKNDIIREAIRMNQSGEQKHESRTDDDTTSHHGSEKKTAPHHQTNSVRVTAVTGLLKNLANTFRDKILGDDAKKLPTIDKRQRREIEEKRNAEMSMQ